VFGPSRQSLALLVACMSFPSMAEAEIRYVAATGRDANPCTQTAPCKTLQRGIDVTPGGGELRVLSSGLRRGDDRQIAHGFWR